MLMTKNGANLIRYQSAFISDNEVATNFRIKKSRVEYLDELDEIIKNNNENFDELIEEDEKLVSKSIDLIKSTNKASTSFLQRNFQITTKQQGLWKLLNIEGLFLRQIMLAKEKF